MGDNKAKMSRMPPPSELPKRTIIPTKYNDPDSSGLSFELTGEAVQFDIELK